MNASIVIRNTGAEYRAVPFGRNVMSFAMRELQDSVSSRWFWLYTIAFGVLAVAVSLMSLAGLGAQGFAGFSRTAAGLLNLIMLIVPLMAMTAGASAIAGERERGTLLYLLAQPVSRGEILLGKFVGLSCALCASLCLGFGVSAAVLAIRTGGVGASTYLVLVALTCVLSVACLSIGLLISVISRKTGVAMGIAVFCWLCLVFLSDLGLMAGTLMFKLRAEELFVLAVANPLQAFKMAFILRVNASIDVLGPAGIYATHTFGQWLQWLLLSVPLIWCVTCASAALALFSRRSSV